MPPSSDVVVVGSVMQDLILSCAELPRRGETVLGRMSVGQGGKGSNQAIASNRAGARTAFVGAVGDDSYAAQIRTFYRRERMACRLATKKSSATGLAVVMLDRDGQNQIVIEPGANASLAPDDVPDALLKSARIVVVQLESNPRATAHALRKARQFGVATLLNPAPMRADFDLKMLRLVDILIPNESEFVALVRRLPGVSNELDEAGVQKLAPDAMHALCRSFGVASVIVTLGSRGCFISQETEHFLLPAYRGIQVVDTTGAGDAFCGGFAAGFVRHDGDMLEACQLGTAVAALSVTKRGAAGAMPRRKELQRFITRNGTVSPG